MMFYVMFLAIQDNIFSFVMKFSHVQLCTMYLPTWVKKWLFISLWGLAISDLILLTISGQTFTLFSRKIVLDYLLIKYFYIIFSLNSFTVTRTRLFFFLSFFFKKWYCIKKGGFDIEKYRQFYFMFYYRAKKDFCSVW